MLITTICRKKAITTLIITFIYNWGLQSTHQYLIGPRTSMLKVWKYNLNHSIFMIFRILILFSSHLFIWNGSSDEKTGLVTILAWDQTDDKPLSKPIMMWYGVTGIKWARRFCLVPMHSSAALIKFIGCIDRLHSGKSSFDMGTCV